MIDILLIEDNADDAEMTIRSLKRKNLADRLKWIKDGVEAVDYLFGQGEFDGRDTAQRPKVIFLDLKLPKLNGLEILELIKNHPSTKKIPVVMLTSSQEEQDILRSYHLGVNSYIVKPLDFEQYADAILSVGMYWLNTNMALQHLVPEYE
ncbi:MAG: response regulator [Bacteroidota bacterium]